MYIKIIIDDIIEIREKIKQKRATVKNLRAVQAKRDEVKIKEYEVLLAQLKGGMRTELISSYSNEVDELRAYLAELREDSG